MEANVSDLHAAASNAACDANPSNSKVAIFFASRLYHLSSSGALNKKHTVCMSCLWSESYPSDPASILAARPRCHQSRKTPLPIWTRRPCATVLESS